jgi:hypothetical protein
MSLVPHIPNFVTRLAQFYAKSFPIRRDSSPVTIEWCHRKIDRIRGEVLDYHMVVIDDELHFIRRGEEYFICNPLGQCQRDELRTWSIFDDIWKHPF